MRLLTWDADGAGAWDGVGAVVGDVQPDVAFLPAVGTAPPAGVRTERRGDGTVERFGFPGDHPLGDYHLWRRRSGDATAAVLCRPAVAGADVVAYPDGEPWPGVVGFGTPGGPSFFAVAAGADGRRGPCSRSILERLDERVGDPWLAAGTFDAPPGALRTRLRERGHDWGVCPPEPSGLVSRVVEESAGDDRPGEGRPADDRPPGYRTAGDPPAGGRPAGDRSTGYLVWSRPAESRGRVLPPAATVPGCRGVVYDVRGPEPAAVRCRDAGRWRAAHSPLAAVAFDRYGSEAGDGAGRPESSRLLTDGGE